MEKSGDEGVNGVRVVDRTVSDLAEAAEALSGARDDGGEGSGGSGGSSSQTLTNADGTERSKGGTGRQTKARDPEKQTKRRKLNGKGELRPWYCASCKQTLKPEDFDTGLETCRVCLAKRRAKDRAKKRLRGLQLKHHLLSADEKDVAAFLLGVYHPSTGRGAPPGDTPSGERIPPWRATQMHFQVSMEVNAFVEDFQSLLAGQPEVEAVQLIRTFFGVDERGQKVHPCDKDVMTATKTKTLSKNKLKYAYGRDVPHETRTEMELRLDPIYKRYSGMLSRVDDQTWVRFAAEDEQHQAGRKAKMIAGTKVTAKETIVKPEVKYSEPIHLEEQRGMWDESGLVPEALKDFDIYSSMNSADPTVNHFLYEFLFSAEAAPTQLPTSMPLSDEMLTERVDEATQLDENSEEQLNGDAYVFEGSIVMGWVGRARGENRKLLKSENGILPNGFAPQAISRAGQLFDARNPENLLPLEETANLHGFSNDLEVFSVLDSSSTDPLRVRLPAGAFSDELGVRALHGGHYIECDVKQGRSGECEVMLYTNGKDGRNPNKVVILGAVYLQCFVQSGTAKMLPIGSNIPVLMIPSPSHVTEIRRGIDEILTAKGTLEARQFILSLAHVLQHGDPSSTRFNFVLEMAHMLRLNKTLNLLERLATLAKCQEDQETLGNESAQGSQDREELQALAIAERFMNAVGRPILCLAAGLLKIDAYALVSTGRFQVRSVFLLLLTMAAMLPTIGSNMHDDLKTFVFVSLFALAHFLDMQTSIVRNPHMGQVPVYIVGLILTYALDILHAPHSRVSTTLSVVVPHLMFAPIGFTAQTVFKVMMRSLPQNIDSTTAWMLRLHSHVVHVALTVAMPLFLPHFIKHGISRMFQGTNKNVT